MRDKAQAVVNREGGRMPTRTEAVRRAIEALGYQADVTQILDYVRETFGIDASEEGPAQGPALTAVGEVAPAAAAAEPAVPRTVEATAEPVHKPASQPRPRSRNRPSSSE